MYMPAVQKRESVALSLETKQQFERDYPLRPFTFEHRISFNFFLLLETFCETLPRMRPENIEWRETNGEKDGGFKLIRTGQDGALKHINDLNDKPGWLMLSDLQELPEYKEFFTKILEEFMPGFRGGKRPLENLRGFIFVSGPQTVTPFHFDPEHNLFFQLRGEKHFSFLPPSAPFLTDEAQEHYYKTGNNILPWQDEFEQHATTNVMNIGEGMYLPFAHPHWVSVPKTRSLSLSLTWSSKWAQQNANVHRFNGAMRKLGRPFGIAPQSPAPYPDNNPAKAFAGRALGRLGLA